MFHASHEERIKQGPLAAAIPIISAIGTVVSAVGMLKGKKTPDAPVIAKPDVMPVADDDAIKRAKRRSITQQLARSGRASTFLSEPEGDALGA